MQMKRVNWSFANIQAGINNSIMYDKTIAITLGITQNTKSAFAAWRITVYAIAWTITETTMIGEIVVTNNEPHTHN